VSRGALNSNRRGQSLVEGTLVLLVFFAILIGVIDCGQVLIAHQSLVERVRNAARWGALHPYDGSGDQVANLVLYNQTSEPAAAGATFLGLTRANVAVQMRSAAPDRTDEQSLSVAIVNYEYHFFSPWLTKPFVNPRPVAVSVPCANLMVGDHPTVPPVPVRP
jgi:Flp pilus assembly protein TadG